MSVPGTSPGTIMTIVAIPCNKVCWAPLRFECTQGADVSPALPRLLDLAQTFRVVEVRLGDRDRRQQRDLLIRLFAVLQEVRQNLDGLRALLGRELLDRRGEAAVAHLRQ